MAIYVEDLKLIFMRYPNNETNCNIENVSEIFTDMGRDIKVAMDFEGNEDLIHLMFLKSYLDEKNISAFLCVDYFPYSRFDRPMNGSFFTLKYVANFINGLNFKEVKIVDAHSDVTPALLNKCKNTYVTKNLFSLVCRQEGLEEPVLFFPDQGAFKKYSKMFDGKYCSFGVKERNLETGEIVKYSIVGGNMKDKDVVIVDDLCSRGGTFVEAAKALKEAGAKRVYLVVTHCELNIFNGVVLRENSDIEKVYTTDSIVKSNTHGATFKKLVIF